MPWLLFARRADPSIAAVRRKLLGRLLQVHGARPDRRTSFDSVYVFCPYAASAALANDLVDTSTLCSQTVNCPSRPTSASALPTPTLVSGAPTTTWRTSSSGPRGISQSTTSTLKASFPTRRCSSSLTSPRGGATQVRGERSCTCIRAIGSPGLRLFSVPPFSSSAPSCWRCT